MGENTAKNIRFLNPAGELLKKNYDKGTKIRLVRAACGMCHVAAGGSDFSE